MFNNLHSRLVIRRIISIALAMLVNLMIYSGVLIAAENVTIKLVNQIESDDDLFSAFFTSFDDLMVAVSKRGNVKIWDIQRGKTVRSWQLKRKPTAVTIDQDQKNFVIGDRRGYIYVWNFETGEYQHKFRAKRKTIEAIAISHDGEVIAAADSTDRIRLWNTKFGRQLGYLEGHTNRVHTLQFGPKGEKLYSVADDKTIRVWDINSKQQIRSIIETKAEWGQLSTFALSPYQEHMAVGVTEVTRAKGNNRQASGKPVWRHLIKLRNGATGEILADFSGHKRTIKQVSFNPAAGILVSISEDHTLRFWDTKKYRQIRSIPFEYEVEKIAFSLDGRWLAAIDKKGMIQVFELAIQKQHPGKQTPIQLANKKEHSTVSPDNLTMAKQNNVSQIYSVVVGIDQYKNNAMSQLNYAKNDAMAFYDLLTSVDGMNVSKKNVQLLVDEKASLVNIKKALGIFLAQNASEQDTVIIFYAGHGAPEADLTGTADDGVEKYLVPYDADPELLYATGLPMTEVENIFKRIISKRVVLFLDTCYSGASGGRSFSAFNYKTRGITRVSRRFLDNLAFQGSGRIILTASRPNELSLEFDRLAHGLFTYYLLDGLKGKADSNQDGNIAIREIYNYIHKNVSTTARQEGTNQNPMLIGAVSGEIIIRKINK